MSQKAWMNAYTKGSKEMQARLAKVHRNNPEFQEFVKKHGFGGNLSVKQSGLQKKSSVATVKPVTDPHPESKKGPQSRELLIKAAAQKIADRRRAHANRVAFGGELGGGFSMPSAGFRTYRESTMDEAREDFKKGDQVRLRKDYATDAPRARKVYTVHHQNADGQFWIGQGSDARGWYVHPHQITMHKKKKTVKEDIAYNDASYTMRRGGWVVKRNGKVTSIILPTEDHAKQFIDSTRETLGHKLGNVLRKKAKEIARGLGRQSLAVESEANRNRILAYDSAVTSSPAPLKVKPKKTITGKMKSYVRRSFAFSKKALRVEAQDPKVLALRAAGKHEEARKLERAALSKEFAKEKREREATKNPKGE